MFNCDLCDKLRCRKIKMPDGRKFCKNCYNKFVEIRDNEIESMVDSMEKRGLSPLVERFLDKNKEPIPREEEDKLRNLLLIKYEIFIDDDIFHDVITSVKETIEERNKLNKFEKELLASSSKKLGGTKDGFN